MVSVCQNVNKYRLKKNWAHVVDHSVTLWIHGNMDDKSCKGREASFPNLPATKWLTAVKWVKGDLQYVSRNNKDGDAVFPLCAFSDSQISSSISDICGRWVDSQMKILISFSAPPPFFSSADIKMNTSTYYNFTTISKMYFSNLYIVCLCASMYTHVCTNECVWFAQSRDHATLKTLLMASSLLRPTWAAPTCCQRGHPQRAPACSRHRRPWTESGWEQTTAYLSSLCGRIVAEEEITPSFTYRYLAQK